jgi:hypothetical protein
VSDAGVRFTAAERRTLSHLRTVAWGLVGVRGHKPHEHGAPALSPLQILITALAFMLVFVLVLVSVALYISRH